jgi:uncharacterized repeat protein (TIGR01451 family)
LNRRKSVMGNGRWSWESSEDSSEDSSEKGSGSSSRKGLVWLPALATVALLVAGSGLLGVSSGRYTQKSASPLSAASGSFLGSSLDPSLGYSLKPKPDARAILGQLPLIFEPNQGQADPRAKFLAHGAGYSLFLDHEGAVLAMQTPQASPAGPSEQSKTQSKNQFVTQFVTMKLVGANPAAVLAGADPLPGKSNYLIGNDPQKWHSGIPQFAGVHYASVYPGIDLIFYGHQGHLEYDFRVAPGANASQPELQFSGANKVELSGGDLILSNPTSSNPTSSSKNDGGLRLHAPYVYQREGDRREPVAGRFVMRAANRVGFEVGPYDHSRELIIDPQLSFSTYFGGSGSETSPSVAVNSDGSIYIVGTTTGSPENTFPPAGAQTLIGPLTLTAASPSHIFVARILPTLPSSVAYETFIGGTGTDTSIGIGVDDGDDVYLVGNTSSIDFPTSNTNVLGYQQAPEGKTQCTASPTCTSIFVSVLSGTSLIPGSQLSYSSYLSGNGDDQASGMTIDNKGDVFITGTTTSNQQTQLPTDAFPATHDPIPIQSLPLTTLAFFVTEVTTTSTGTFGIAYSTYFGGGTPTPPAGVAIGGGIAVDPTGNIYFSGSTNFYNSGTGAYGDNGQSADFLILNAYQACLDTPPPITGLLSSNPCTSPTTTPFPTDAFVAKINPTGPAGTQLLFSTYFGGGATESGPGIALNSGATAIYLTGSTNSNNFVTPTGIVPYQSCLDTPVNPLPPATCPAIAAPAPTDAYLAVMTNPTQSTTGVPNDVGLTYFTYLGGGGNDSGLAIAVDSSGDALLTGATSSGAATGTSSFPVTIPGAIQTQLAGPQNAFFAQINPTTSTIQTGLSYVTYYGGNGVDSGTGIAVDPLENTYLVGQTTSTNLEVEDWLTGENQLNGPSDAFVLKLGTLTSLCINCTPPVVSVLGTVGAGNSVTITFTVTNNGPDPATNISVNGQVPVNSGVTFNSATAGSGTCSTPSNNAVICLIPTLQSGSSSLVVFTVTPTTPGTFQATATVTAANNTNGGSNTASASFSAGAYAMEISPPAQTVAAGLSAPFGVNVYPTQGTFPSPITLTCSALPAGATCSFASNTFSLVNGPQSILLTLTTTAQPETTVTSAPWRRPLYALWLMVPGMALLRLGGGKKRRRWGKMMGRLLSLLALFVLLALVLLQPSCSSNRTQPTVSGTPSGSYHLTVTATSGSFTQSQPFSLTVVP